MYYLITDETNRVILLTVEPTKEQMSNSVKVDVIPKPDENGKIPILYCNSQTKELWYEYEDRPLTPEEELAQVKAQLQATQQAVDFLLMGGM